MPLDLRLTSLTCLTTDHVPLLQHFVAVANSYANFMKQHDTRLYARRRFITGFHALPSLPMLHMHLLTLDLDSPYLKTKKHYNSFATFFFLTSGRVIDDLQRHGRVTLNRDVKTYHAMENQDMKCL
uniref:Uncharacterized protein n=1 Tax=Lygus hesperus TaxID=30085 RepID=A0A0A9Y4L8_LYGHE